MKKYSWSKLIYNGYYSEISWGWFKDNQIPGVQRPEVSTIQSLG